MPKHEILDPDRPGRRSGIRRLVYRSSANGQANDSGVGKGQWRDSRDWSAIKDQLRLTVRRAPEVLINVKGSRRVKDDDHAAIESVLRYMMYISRNGRLTATNERGERIDGREAIRETHASWDLDMQRMRSGKNELLHPSFNLIFSMPAETDPDKILEAVAAVAQERFAGHQYLMALHTPETDPADDPPAHPHVHLILRAEDENGRRIHIRKGDLRTWREQFAAELRARGIEANATSRAERGRSTKAVGGAEWHINKRYEENLRQGKSVEPPKAKAARFLEAAQELQDGLTEEKPWEIAMAARRRDVLRDLTQSATRLRDEGENDLADEVDRFIQDMAPLDSERRRIQRAMVKQVHERLQERDQEKESDFPE
jgi:hypothetical protein